MNNVFKVIACGEQQVVASQKAEDGSIAKRQIVLQELGGKYADSFVATLLGNLAQAVFYPGEAVMAALRFQSREYNGQFYQDILVSDIVKFKV